MFIHTISIYIIHISYIMIHDTVGEKKTAGGLSPCACRHVRHGLLEVIRFTGFTEDFNGNLMRYPQLLAT